MDDLRKAAKLAADESSVLHANALSSNNMRNQIKLQKLTGESWQQIAAPMSPVTTDRNRNIIKTADEHDRQEAQMLRAKAVDQDSKLRSFFGARPAQ